MFSQEFCKIFKKFDFAEHLQTAASNDVVITRFVCNFDCSLKWKRKWHVRQFFFYNVYLSNDNDTKVDLISAINFAIRFDDLSELRSLIRIWKIKWTRFWHTDGFTWSFK